MSTLLSGESDHLARCVEKIAATLLSIREDACAPNRQRGAHEYFRELPGPEISIKSVSEWSLDQLITAHFALSAVSVPD